MAWFVGQSILFIALAFLLGLLVGWLIWGRWPRVFGEPAAEPAAAPDPAPEPDRAPGPVAAVPRAAPASDGPPDDLERIEGIGPKMAGALRRAGIRTYRQLAESDVDQLRLAIEKAGLHFAPSLTTWARQARLLADGDEEGFADLTRRLVAGREVGR